MPSSLPLRMMTTMIYRHHLATLATARVGLIRIPLRPLVHIPRYIQNRRGLSEISAESENNSKDDTTPPSDDTSTPPSNPAIALTYTKLAAQRLIQHGTQEATGYAFRGIYAVFASIFGSLLSMAGSKWYSQQEKLNKVVNKHSPGTQGLVRLALDKTKTPKEAVSNCQAAIKILGDPYGEEAVDVWVELADAWADGNAGQQTVIVDALREALKDIDIEDRTESGEQGVKPVAGVRIKAALGGLLVGLNELAEAKVLLVEAAKACQVEMWEVGSDVRGKVATELRKLGDCHKRMAGDLHKRKADDHYEQKQNKLAFDIYCEAVPLLPGNTVDRMDLLNRTAKACSRLVHTSDGRKPFFEEAIVLQAQALEVAKDIKNKDRDFDYTCAMAWYNLARFSEKLGGNYKPVAIKLLREAKLCAVRVRSADGPLPEWWRIEKKLHRAEERLMELTTWQERLESGMLDMSAIIGRFRNYGR